MFRRGPFSRWDRLQQMFDGAEGLTIDDYERMLHDAVHPWWEEDLPFFEGWTAEEAEVEWARAVLAAWDGNYDRVEVAPALHNVWRRQLAEEARASDTPPDRRRAFTHQALGATLDTLRVRLGPDRSDWRWGRIHRSEFPHWLVSAYDLPTVERSGGGGTVAATGATFREIISFDDLDNSRATSAPGQSMQPGSPFYGNLLPLWAEEEFFPLLYSRRAVDAGTRYRLLLRPPA